MSERDLEAPEADTIEQDAEVVPEDTEAEAEQGRADAPDDEVPLEVDPADLAEQQRSVGVADDDYR
jgi:hypothetical protein